MSLLPTPNERDDPGQTPQVSTPDSDARLANRRRFELELEFVQALGNPHYLHTLALQGILDQPAFIEYLKYLNYWKEREYARFLQLSYVLLQNP
jgi:mediator of RNA polymerase II transcription subunit 31